MGGGIESPTKFSKSGSVGVEGEEGVIFLRVFRRVGVKVLREK